MTAGATLPPRCPSMFMKNPETVPTCSPPISMAVVQEIGPLNSAAEAGKAEHRDRGSGFVDAQKCHQEQRCARLSA